MKKEWGNPDFRTKRVALGDLESARSFKPMKVKISPKSEGSESGEDECKENVNTAQSEGRLEKGNGASSDDLSPLTRGPKGFFPSLPPTPGEVRYPQRFAPYGGKEAKKKGRMLSASPVRPDDGSSGGNSDDATSMVERTVGPWDSISQVTTKGAKISGPKKVVQTRCRQAMKSRRKRRMQPDVARKTAEQEKRTSQNESGTR